MILCWNNNLEMFCYELSEVHGLKHTLSSQKFYIPQFFNKSQVEEYLE